MSTTSLIRVREKNQITLPADIVHSLGLNSPGHLQYTILRDGVLIRSFSAPQENKISKIRRLKQSVQSAYKG
jgi:bifunctional DNA-binding transcriptional regulator/antitoxin component of YhaV-PrlF toxin-antitoxin module